MCTETYVVAVVHKGSGVTWNTLRGRKSSHTGLNTDAGWNVHHQSYAAIHLAVTYVSIPNMHSLVKRTCYAPFNKM